MKFKIERNDIWYYQPTKPGSIPYKITSDWGYFNYQVVGHYSKYIKLTNITG